ASWHGYNATAEIYVQLAVPSFLTPQPAAIAFSTLNQTFQLTVIATYTDGTEKDVTNLANYHGYNPSFCSVNSDGLLTSLANGSPIIQVDYVDPVADPHHVVTTTISFGPQDPILQIETFRIQPEYAIAGQDNLPITVSVTGPNQQNITSMTYPSGLAVCIYVGLNSGTDNLTALLLQPVTESNHMQINWFNPPAAVCVS